MQDILSFTVQYVISDGSGMKNLPANAGDMGLIPGLERYPEEENGTPLQNSCLGNPMIDFTLSLLFKNNFVMSEHNRCICH